MAWNRPNEVRSAKCEVRSAKKIVHRASCIVLGVVCLVVLGVGGYFLFFGDAAPARGTKHEARSTIPEAKHESRVTLPQVRSTKYEARSTRGVAPTNKIEATKNVKPPEIIRSELYNIMSSGRLLFPKPLFTNTAENIIGAVLSVRPGTRMLPVELEDDFDKEFIDSMKAEIVISQDDSPDDVLVKEAVIKAKEQIAAMMKSGQKAFEIVSDLRAEVNKVADYRDSLEEDFCKLKEKGSAERIQAYLKEANALLDEFGAERLELSDEEVDWINDRLEKEKTGELEKADDAELSNMIIEVPKEASKR